MLNDGGIDGEYVDQGRQENETSAFQCLEVLVAQITFGKCVGRNSSWEVQNQLAFWMLGKSGPLLCNPLHV